VRPDQRRRTIGVRKGLKGRSRYSVNAPDKAGGSVRSTDATAMQPGDGARAEADASNRAAPNEYSRAATFDPLSFLPVAIIARLPRTRIKKC